MIWLVLTLKPMRFFLFAPLLLFLLIGCNSERKSKYNECMESGIEKLYGEKLTPDFCECFSDSLTRGKLPFEAGNTCSKPIIEKMLEQKKLI